MYTRQTVPYLMTSSSVLQNHLFRCSDMEKREEDASVPVDYLISSLVIPPPLRKSQSEIVFSRRRRRPPERKKPSRVEQSTTKAPTDHPAFSTRAQWRVTEKKTLGGRGFNTSRPHRKVAAREKGMTMSASLSSILLNSQLSVAEAPHCREKETEGGFGEQSRGGLLRKRTPAAEEDATQQEMAGQKKKSSAGAGERRRRRVVTFLVSPGPDPSEPFVVLGSPQQ